MPHTSRRSAIALLPLLLLALLGACGSASPLSRPLPGPLIPPLPANARQLPKPPMCSPTCSDVLTTERENSLATPTTPAPAARPASAPTTP